MVEDLLFSVVGGTASGITVLLVQAADSRFASE